MLTALVAFTIGAAVGTYFGTTIKTVLTKIRSLLP